MTFADLLNLLCPDQPALADFEITGVQLDSRLIQPGQVFIAIAGTASHGLHHLDQALALGAIAVLYDDWVGPAPVGVPSRSIPNLRNRLADIGAAWHKLSFNGIPVFGVTGTNGKTTVVSLIAQLATKLGLPMGRIGTLGVGFGRDVLSNADRTTSDALTLAGQCADLLARGARGIAMEVSSHALDQGRVTGIPMTVGVFTNLTRDHLDYHQTMARYGDAKMRLFRDFALTASVLCVDDPFIASMAGTVRGELWTVGQEAGSRVRLSRVTPDAEGSLIEIQVDQATWTMRSPLFGLFNAQNVVLAMTALVVAGLADWAQLIPMIPTLEPAPGRMERFDSADRPTVIVDYAHTPDAMEQVLITVRQHTTGRLWVVFGCGGDRDSGKRAEMGAIAERLADHVILTDDNPRFESAAVIIEGIRDGMQSPPFAVIHDRASAIRRAIESAARADCIVVAGKGHERTQVVGTRVIPYSDRATVASHFGLMDGIA